MQFSRQRVDKTDEAPAQAKDLSDGRPDLISLDQFASKIRFLRGRESKTHRNFNQNTESRPRSPPSQYPSPTTVTQTSEQPQASLQESHVPETAASQGREDALESTTPADSASASQAPAQNAIAEEPAPAAPGTTSSVNEPPTSEQSGSNTAGHSNFDFQVADQMDFDFDAYYDAVAAAAAAGPAAGPATDGSVDQDNSTSKGTNTNKPDRIFNLVNGEGTPKVEKEGSQRLGMNQPTLLSSSWFTASMSVALPKRKDTAAVNRWKPSQVYVPPRNKLEILRTLRIAGSATMKIEDLEESPTDKDKLRTFLRILSSKNHQIELFGKELPLCKASLVGVREDGARATTYICIHGFRNAADITRFHSAMSHKRYRQLYDPLKLCYDTEQFGSKSGSADSELVKQDPLGPASFVLSPIPELTEAPRPESSTEKDTTQTFYHYKPVAEDRTYCGALFRRTVGRPCVATLGGLVVIDGMTYIMSCQHGFTENSTPTMRSLADTLVETDLPDDVEGPLVFSLGSVPDGPGDLPELDATPAQDADPSSAQDSNAEWKALPISGAIIYGPEWCLIPIERDAILPNFVERSRTEKDKDSKEPEIHYLEKISEPRASSPVLIITSSNTECSGVVSPKTSFIFGGGTAEEPLEVWTVLLKEGQRT